jgi:polyferredoxin
MPTGWRRIKTLHGLGRRRGRMHRYAVVRWLVAVSATAGVALLPWTGVLRLDLWGGHHLWLGREVGLVEGLQRFAFPFLGVNAAIILASRFLGRYLCGFGCPVGALARLDEWFRFRLRKSNELRALSDLLMLALCAALAWVAFSFWTDVRVLRRGSPGALAVAWTALCAAAAGLYVISACAAETAWRSARTWRRPGAPAVRCPCAWGG